MNPDFALRLKRTQFLADAINKNSLGLILTLCKKLAADVQNYEERDLDKEMLLDFVRMHSEGDPSVITQQAKRRISRIIASVMMHDLRRAKRLLNRYPKCWKGPKKFVEFLIQENARNKR